MAGAESKVLGVTHSCIDPTAPIIVYGDNLLRTSLVHDEEYILVLTDPERKRLCLDLSGQASDNFEVSCRLKHRPLRRFGQVRVVYIVGCWNFAAGVTAESESGRTTARRVLQFFFFLFFPLTVLPWERQQIEVCCPAPSSSDPPASSHLFLSGWSRRDITLHKPANPQSTRALQQGCNRVRRAHAKNEILIPVK
ncbi:hypothetical protein VTO42DRAFT_4149 [Malbranchea cinnamomea]